MSYPNYDFDCKNNVTLFFDEEDKSKKFVENDDGDPNHNVIFIGVKVIDKWDYIKHCTETYFKNNYIPYASYIDMYKNAGFKCKIFSSKEMNWTLDEVNKILSISGYFDKLVAERKDIVFE